LRYRIGRFLWWNKKDEIGAEAQFEEASRLDPRNAFVQCQHGLFMLSRATRLHDQRASESEINRVLDRAEQMLRGAVSSKPASSVCRYHLGHFLFRSRGRHDDASAEFALAAKGGDDVAKTLFQWAWCADEASVLRLGRRARSIHEDAELRVAMDRAERAVQLAHELPGWKHQLAHLLEDKQEYKERARSLYTETAGTSKIFASARNLCLAYFLEAFGGEPNVAYDIFERIATENPDQPSATLHLARARFVRGDLKSGRVLLPRLQSESWQKLPGVKPLAFFLLCAFGPPSEAEKHLHELRHWIRAPEFEPLTWDLVGLVDRLDSSCGVAPATLHDIASKINGLKSRFA
jgi:Tfp pilus assembly protein PilF